MSLPMNSVYACVLTPISGISTQQIIILILTIHLLPNKKKSISVFIDEITHFD